jgi:hypothetical protein
MFTECASVCLKLVHPCCVTSAASRSTCMRRDRRQSRVRNMMVKGLNLICYLEVAALELLLDALLLRREPVLLGPGRALVEQNVNIRSIKIIACVSTHPCRFTSSESRLIWGKRQALNENRKPRFVWRMHERVTSMSMMMCCLNIVARELFRGTVLLRRESVLLGP